MKSKCVALPNVLVYHPDRLARKASSSAEQQAFGKNSNMGYKNYAAIRMAHAERKILRH